MLLDSLINLPIEYCSAHVLQNFTDMSELDSIAYFSTIGN